MNSEQNNFSIYVFMGPPGAGKGSVAQLCQDNFGWKWLSTGDLCRKHVAQGTETGKIIDFAMKSGKLIPNSMVGDMVVEWLVGEGQADSSIILDGYPRTREQAQYFSNAVNDMFGADALGMICIVRFVVSDEQVLYRLCNRYICERIDCQAIYSCGKQDASIWSSGKKMCKECGGTLVRRDDDKESVIRKRLEMYYKYENNLLSFYKENGRSVVECSADSSLQEAFGEFKKLLVDVDYD